jgi:hypothetical protein
MKATLAKTVDGYKIILEKESENIALYLLNLGANRRDGHFLYGAAMQAVAANF